jgi:hypothetical protein
MSDNIIINTKEKVFICAPYRRKPGHSVEKNKRRVRKHAVELWESGKYLPIIPHLNNEYLEDSEALLAGLELLQCCDTICILNVKGLGHTEGMNPEIKLARLLGLKFMYVECRE